MQTRRHWLIALAVLLVASFAPTYGAYFLAYGPHSWMAIPFFHGLLVLIAFWSALSSSPLPIRWSCGCLALWRACPKLGPDLVARDWLDCFSQFPMAWEVAEHVVLTFAVLVVLRMSSLHICRPINGAAEPHFGRRWQFTLRTLFASVAAAAIVAWTWKRAFPAFWLIAYPRSWSSTWEPWELVVAVLGMSLWLTTFDILALWAVLRPGGLGWRLALFSFLIAASQIIIWHFADKEIYRVGPRASGGLLRTFVYDLCYFGPVLAVLFIVRCCGYRWTASRSLSP